MLLSDPEKLAVGRFAFSVKETPMEKRYRACLRIMIEQAAKEGCIIRYRPDNLKFDEREVTLLPDVLSVPTWNFSVWDKVRLYSMPKWVLEEDARDLPRRAPWHMPSAGESRELIGGGHLSRSEYRILSFAKATLRGKNATEGLFCVLVDDYAGGGYIESLGSVFLGQVGHVYLHWIGALENVRTT